MATRKFITLDNLTSYSDALAAKIKTKFASKQDALVAGDGIAIAADGKTISTTVGADVTALTTRVAANEAAITTLNGTGDGSVSKAVSDGIASVVADAPASFDTLKEISDWISEHADSAAAMNTAIQTNAANIAKKQDALTDAQLAAANSGITADKVATYDGYAAQITANKVTVDSALSSTSTNPVQNKVINTALAGKQATLTTAQLAAANSGITAAKVTTYDGYASQISAKQDALSSDDATFTSGVMTINTATTAEIEAMVSAMDF